MPVAAEKLPSLLASKDSRKGRERSQMHRFLILVAQEKVFHHRRGSRVGFPTAQLQCEKGVARRRCLPTLSSAVTVMVAILGERSRREMQQLLLQIWDETACTILFVTHDVEEAVYLADRIFIMSSHPGTIVEDVQVSFDRPRELELKEKSEFHDLQHYVLGVLKRAPGIGGHVRVSV